MHTREYLRKDLLSQLLKLSVRQIYRNTERVEVKGKIFFKIPLEVRNMKPGDTLLKVSEAAKILNINKSTINRWFWEGKLSGTKLGKDDKSSIRIFKSSVDNLIGEGENK